MVSDTRRLRIHQIRSAKGELDLVQAADVWQDPMGKILTSGLWDGVLVPSQEDLDLLAKEAGVSALEMLRQRLLTSATVVVEITGHAKV